MVMFHKYITAVATSRSASPMRSRVRPPTRLVRGGRADSVTGGACKVVVIAPFTHLNRCGAYGNPMSWLCTMNRVTRYVPRPCCPTPGASLPTGGGEHDGQCDERHDRCEPRCVEHQQRPQRAAADKPNQHQQMVAGVAGGGPGG